MAESEKVGGSEYCHDERDNREAVDWRDMHMRRHRTILLCWGCPGLRDRGDSIDCRNASRERILLSVTYPPDETGFSYEDQSR